MNNNNSIFQRLDYTLIFLVFLLFCCSLLAINAAPPDPSAPGTNYVKKQIFWYVFSAIVGFLIAVLDYERLRMVHWFLYGFGILLLLGLTAASHGVPVPFAHASHGAWSWYRLPGLGQIQPSEFMKVFLILSLGQVVTSHNETYTVKSLREDFLLLGKIILVSAVPLLLILIQPDLGTALIMMSIIAAIIIVSGINWRIIVGIFSLIVLGLGGFIVCFLYAPHLISFILESHQVDRFYGWLWPYEYSNEQGYQLINSLNAIGSGQLFGHGGLKSSGIYLPEGQNDFIFASIAGSFGFIGAAIVVTLLFLLIYRIVHAAIATKDPFGSYICTGIIGMITFQIFENIGMTIQVMPITGITLPFLSYGGSSLLTCMASIGLVLSIQARTKLYMFD
ncbi:cell division protein FtsW (lipid II flippase) [Scopulibacillus daqui]|uniref:Cell division protein FtsW (Lipid II flippase) n=1 Tax=Scopulibacillus daqui TaxID=1469162 RepID=A0ABS2PVY5_9BACL|nr:FtsW/RodA/SpoVE family cell cycle protein [Scopulibacillus daqui]MBM7644046.1 cell division protein FtsW (lipid II flippase) [Scopulibacillus daqui]